MLTKDKIRKQVQPIEKNKLTIKKTISIKKVNNQTKVMNLLQPENFEGL